MKQCLPILSLAFLIACNSKPSDTATETKTIQSAQAANSTIDTTGLAQFQQWKAQNELAAANEAQQKPAAAVAPVKTTTVVREVRVPERTTVHKTVKHTTESKPSGTSNAPAGTGSTGASGQGSSTSESSNTASAPATQPAEAQKNKGWSKSAKGAAIGGAGGAVLGAIINKKNRAVGAVIGGVLGAGVGYGIGKKKQSKDTVVH